MASLLCCLNFNMNLSQGVLNVDTLQKGQTFSNLTEKNQTIINQTRS